MLSYYLEKGITPEHILSLSPTSRMFYMASMLLNLEQKKNTVDAINKSIR